MAAIFVWKTVKISYFHCFLDKNSRHFEKRQIISAEDEIDIIIEELY